MPAQSTHEDILDKFLTRLGTIAAAQLDGLPIEEALALDQDWEQNIQVPCVLVSPVGLDGEFAPETLSGKDAWLYPMTVRILQRTDRADKAWGRKLLKYRQAIKRAFHHQHDGAPFTSADLVGDILYQQTPTLEPALLQYQLVSSPLLFNVLTREPRT